VMMMLSACSSAFFKISCIEKLWVFPQGIGRVTP